MALPLRRDARWIFIGDSITECDRQSCPDGLGVGFVRLISDYLAARDPVTAPVVVNSGIAGHRVADLGRRWEDDVLSRQPDLISVKIGINDALAGLVPEWGPGPSVEEFREEYSRLLHETRTRFPDATLVLCEPTVIWAPAHAEGNAYLRPFVAAVGELAQKFQARALVPLHNAFERAAATRPDIVWTSDGVHPTRPGHMLIARHWLAALGLL